MHSVRSVSGAVCRNPHAAYSLLCFYRNGRRNDTIQFCELSEFFYKHRKTFDVADELYHRHNLYCNLSSHSLSPRLYFGAQQIQKEKCFAHALHYAYVDQFCIAHHRTARTSGSDRLARDGQLFEYHYRNGVRFSAVYDPALIYHA